MIVDNSQIREIGPTEPCLSAVARIYAQMPTEWTAVGQQSTDDYSLILQTLTQTLSSADGALFAVTPTDDFVAAFTWVVGLNSKERRAHLNAIWVAPDYREKGIGALLLNRVEEKARASNITAITAHVHGLNARMLAFALRHHFSLGYLLIEKELGNPSPPPA